MKLLKKTPVMTLKALAEHLHVNEKTIKRDIENLKSKGKLERLGSARKGEWVVTM